ncbi:MAG: bifunctional nuclease family protein [Micropruina sp.]|nr:MAG: bifunctional nuclease family protein [Micropruina sp.]
MREVGIVEVRVAGSDESPVVVLKEAAGTRLLAIWMSATGAAGIMAALEPPDVDHPSSHDLVCDLAEAFQHRIEAVQIIGHADGVFYAELVVDGDSIPARPSDALAIAVRAGCPIRCAEAVLASVGIEAVPEPEPETPSARSRSSGLSSTRSTPTTSGPNPEVAVESSRGPRSGAACR